MVLIDKWLSMPMTFLWLVLIGFLGFGLWRNGKKDLGTIILTIVAFVVLLPLFIDFTSLSYNRTVDYFRSIFKN